MRDYIPREDKPALVWLRNFAQKLTANPSLYGVSSADCENISAVVDAFAESMAAIEDPDRRNKGTLILKSQLKASAEQLCRSFAQRIKADDGVPDDRKNAAGVPPKNPNRQGNVEVPATQPLLSIVAGVTGSMTLRFNDTMDPNKRGKPYGAAALQLFCHVGEAAAADPEEARFVGLFTRGPIGVPFAPADNRKVATFYARWSNRRGEAGPFSRPASMTIAA